ncbi:MAG TPA: hypothetical protein VGL58_17415 [Caulobacteraceae bacterium]
MTISTTAPARSVRPWLFFILYLPFGGSGGFMAGALEYFYSKAGVSTAALGAVLSIALLPSVLKVFWAPLVDVTLTTKRWFVLSMAVMIPGLAATALLPPGTASLPALTALALLVSVSGSTGAMAAESLMAHGTAPEARGAAGGWSQAGNVGGSGLGGGAGLWLAAHLHSLALSGLVVSGSFVVFAAAILLAPASTRFTSHPSYLAMLKAVAGDCWQACRSRPGLLTLLLFVLPLGSGGEAYINSAIAKEWHVGADLLAGINWVVGLATVVAAVGGGLLCDRMDRKTAYVLFGVIGGLVAGATALAPRTPEVFVVFVFAYSAALGLSYAAFSATTLEAIGAGAAATKYNLFACISNIPVFIMPALDGWADTRWNGGAVMWTEFAVALGGAALFNIVVLATRPRRALAPA